MSWRRSCSNVVVAQDLSGSQFQLQINLEHDTIAVWNWLKVEEFERRIKLFFACGLTTIEVLYLFYRSKWVEPDMLFGMPKVFQNKDSGTSQEWGEVWSYWFFACRDTLIDTSIWFIPFIWVWSRVHLGMSKVIPNIASAIWKDWIKL